MTKQIANLQLIKVLINSKVNAKEIDDKTGVHSELIKDLRNGNVQLENISLSSAIKLTSFAENKIIIQASELLDKMKNSKEFDYVIYTDKHKKEFLKNSDTQNLQSIFNDKSEKHLYGVYGDVVGGQIDNSSNTDEEIKQAIIKMLSLGNIVAREEVFNK